MAAGVDIVTNANQWVITYNGTTAAHTLPYTIWSLGPFIAQRIIWTAKGGAAGDEVIISDAQSASDIFFHAVADAQNFMMPYQWKRARFEAAPYGAIIRTFNSGELIVHF